MSLPVSFRTSVTPTELELIACQELIDIIPLITMEKTAFISGPIGPLRPPRKAKVPIWMAVNLKMKKKCHIVAPDWLNADFLQQRVNDEEREPQFSSLPFRFAEISKVLLNVASDDLENSDTIRILLKDLREKRQAKIRKGLGSLDQSMMLTNLCSMEINEIRSVLVESVWVLNQLMFQPSEEQPVDEFL